MTSYTHSYTDGGRRSTPGFENETNDCTVRAFAVFMNVGYAEAHAECKSFGRRNGRGMMTADIRSCFKKHGYTVSTVPGPNPTLAQFARANPTGTHYLFMRRHVAVLQNGVLLDSWKVGPHTRIQAFYSKPTQIQESKMTAVNVNILVTAMQAAMIDRIVHDLYQPLNGGEPTQYSDLSDIWAGPVLKTMSDGGVFSTLRAKGLVVKNGKTVRLTEAGWEVYIHQVKK